MSYNPNLIDEENTEILMSDNDIFYADELEIEEENEVEEDDASSELNEKDFEGDYFSDPAPQLLDEITDEEDEEQETKKKSKLKESFKLTSLILLDELMQPENYRTKRRFMYEGEKYHGYVVAKLNSAPDRFVFNMLPENQLKAININDIKLI